MICLAECKSVIGCSLLVLSVALIYQTACDAAEEVLVGADTGRINSIATGDGTTSIGGELVEAGLLEI